MTVAPTLLSILAMGAIYANERETGDRLHETSLILIGNVQILCYMLTIVQRKGQVSELSGPRFRTARADIKYSIRFIQW